MSGIYSNSMWGIQLSEWEPVIQLAPEFGELVSIWGSTPLHQMTLTSRGIVIAHANLKRLIPDFNADLSIWIK
jgi:hypothetical protein